MFFISTVAYNLVLGFTARIKIKIEGREAYIRCRPPVGPYFDLYSLYDSLSFLATQLYFGQLLRVSGFTF
jgi:hypothetical protein